MLINVDINFKDNFSAITDNFLVHCCIIYLPYYKTTIKICFFLIFLKSSYKVKSQSLPSPILIHCLQKECCENTACSKKAAFFKYLCIW